MNIYKNYNNNKFLILTKLLVNLNEMKKIL